MKEPSMFTGLRELLAVRQRTIVVGDNTGIRMLDVGVPGLAIVDTRDDVGVVKIDNLNWLGTASTCRECQNHV